VRYRLLFVFSLFSHLLSYHLSLSFRAYELFESFYEGLMFLVFDQNATIFVYQFRCRSFTVPEDRYSQKHCFHGSDSVAFFGQIDESFGLTDDFDSFVDIADSSYKDDSRSCDGFEIFFVGAASHDDQ